MGPEAFINFNGKIIKNNKPVILADNRSFRYGDGCFETMKMLNGKIILEAYHFERLFTSLKALQFNKSAFFISETFKEEIVELAKKNHHKKAARIRVTIARGSGGLYDVQDHYPNYVIETWDLNGANNKFNENGLVLDIYRDARKVCDCFSAIKNNNFLCYTMAALWAKENKLNDAVILNPYNRIADTTVANIFIVQNGIVKTPALSEGCIAGVMRKYLMECLRKEGIPFEETEISLEDLLSASEVFVTNAIKGLYWVKEIGQSNYNQQLSSFLHKKFVMPLFA
jgi:aminodeoxychorismate lyase